MTGKLRFLNELQVAELLGISVKTLRRWRLVCTGPPYRKLGGWSVRYDIEEVKAWIDRQPRGGDQRWRGTSSRLGAGARPWPED